MQPKCDAWMRPLSNRTDRPIYETEDDRRRQAIAVGVLADASNSVAVPTSPLSGWDYELHRDGKPVAIVEVKCRRCSRDTYPTYMVSRMKVEKLRDAALGMGIAGGLLVRWEDSLGWLRVDNTPPSGWQTATGGRIDRNDPLDIERVIHFPITAFRLLDARRRAFA